MTTQESPVQENVKQLSIEKGVNDTIYGPYFDGLGCRSMKTKASEKAYRRGFLGLPNFPAALINSKNMARMFNFPYMKLLIGVVLSGRKNAIQMAYMANAFRAMRTAIEDGEIERRGVLPAGQSTGLIHNVPKVSELIEGVIQEADGILKRLNTIGAS